MDAMQKSWILNWNHFAKPFNAIYYEIVFERRKIFFKLIVDFLCILLEDENTFAKNTLTQNEYLLYTLYNVQ